MGHARRPPHAGEDPWLAAQRETEEEIGKFPPPYDCAGTFHHVEDDGKTQVYLYLCTVPYFHPSLDGATPEETRGAAWFRRKEIGGLDLTPKFREDWEKGSEGHHKACGYGGRHQGKSLQRTVNENGEVCDLTDASQPLQASAAAGRIHIGRTARNGPTRDLGAIRAASPGGERAPNRHQRHGRARAA